MATVYIDHNETEVLEVNVEGRAYNVPLLTNLTLKETRELIAAEKAGDDAEIDLAIKYIGRFIPKKVLDSFRMQDLAKIMTSLKGATLSAGENVGES